VADIAAARDAAAGTAAATQLAILTDLTTLADAEEAQLGPLLQACAGVPVARVDQLARDVYDLDGITDIADRIAG